MNALAPERLTARPVNAMPADALPRSVPSGVILMHPLALAQRSMLRSVFCAAVVLGSSAHAFSDAELRAAAATFPAMPVDTATMSQLLGRPATFSSGGPFNDLEFTVFNTDYIDGENGGFDTFHPASPGTPNPGSHQIRYVRTALNTDLNARYGIAQGDRIILGTVADGPYFLRGPDGIDNDYAVIHHFDFVHGAIELAGARSDYALVQCTTAQGCRTSGWFVFHVRAAQPDLVAFVHACDALEGGVSGNPPQDPLALCNASRVLGLDDAAQFRFARPVGVDAAVPKGVVQFGTPGKDLLGAVTGDAAGNLYFVGNTDGDFNGGAGGPNRMYVYSTTAEGTRRWVHQLALPDGTTLKGAVADGEFLYACGRTLGALPGFVSAGRWDGILLKLRLGDGVQVGAYQWGNPGIDGYGSCILDETGQFLFLSGQGAPPGPATTDPNYLVAKHRTSDLTPVWVALPTPPTTGFAASAEAWGRLAYRPGATPGEGRLLVSGWYMAQSGADAFIALFDQLDQPQPRLVRDLVLPTQQGRAEWVLGAAFDTQGRIFVVGYTSGQLASAPQGEGDLFLGRYDANLQNPVFAQFGTPKSEWTRTFGLVNDRLVVVGNTFGDYAAPNADPERRTGDAFVATFDLDLRLVARTQFGSPQDDRALGFIRPDRIVVAGTTEGSVVDRQRGGYDVYAVQLDPRTLAVVSPASTFNADQFDLSGGWFEPETSGQGLMIDVFDSASRGPGSKPYLFGGWFTYTETAGGVEQQAWYALEGEGAPGSNTYALQIGRVGSGAFDVAVPVPPTRLGSATLRFESCTRATLDYRFDAIAGGRSGQVRLQRLLTDVSCDAGARVANAPRSFLSSGGWFVPGMDGQGLLFEFNPTQPTLFGAWFTQAPAGATPGPRWFSLQAPSVGVSQTRFDAVPIYANIGARFDTPGAPTLTPVGSADLELSGDCRQITLSYRFNAGELSGRSGTQRLQRLGPLPRECASP